MGHGKPSAVSPVNGKISGPPTPGAPVVVSSNGPSSADHSRKPSVTMSGNLPNGASAGPSPRPHAMQFGAINNGSPAVVNSNLHVPQSANLTTPIANSGPARTPSPIPAPSTSGGRPPTGPQSQGNPLNFGNFAGNDSGPEGTVSFSSSAGALIYNSKSNSTQLRPGLPQGPAGPQHLRRDSNHSQQSELAGNSRHFTPNANRRSQYNQGFQPNMSSPSFQRVNPALPIGRNMSNPQNFSPAQLRATPNSPYQANQSLNRSPAPTAAVMHTQPQFHNGPHMHPQYGGHYMNQSVKPPSLPRRFSNSFQQEATSQDRVVLRGGTNPATSSSPPPPTFAPDFPPPDFSSPQAFGQYLTLLQAPMYSAVPQEYSVGPFPTPYYPHPGYLQQGMHPMAYSQTPPSPRPAYNPPSAVSAPFIPQQYQPQIPMQRLPSHSGSIDRPDSTVHQAPSPAVSGPSIPPSGSPAPVVRTERKISKAIVIKGADGQVVDLKTLASQAVTHPKSSGPPAIVSSTNITPDTKTPTPKTAEAPKPVKVEVPSVPDHHDAEETKRKFQEKIQASLKQSKGPESAAGESTKQADAPAVKSAEKVEEPAKAAETKVEPESEKPVEDEEDEMEKFIREMEEKERLEEERQTAYEAKKKIEKEALAAKEKEAALKVDEELKRQEREAEERETAKESGEVDDESAELFKSLKKSTLIQVGPEESSGPPTPSSDSMPPPSLTPTSSKPLSSRPQQKTPQPLKVDTTKVIEPAQPTAGMQSLRSSRMLKVQDEVAYPSGFQSPNPALNQTGKGSGFHYNKEFLLQFQVVFKEKPSVDWDKILRDTVGDGGDSARPQSARTPSMGARSSSHRGPSATMPFPGMGQFSAGGRTLPPGTTSADRFAASQRTGSQGPMPSNPLAHIVNRPGGMSFPMSAPSMSRQGSQQSRQLGPNLSARQGSSRNKSKQHSEKDMARTMPLTAGKDLKPIEVSKTGWKAASLAGPAAAQSTTSGGLIAPDVVQRKVKASLNKMTPEKFDKISDDILTIANQSEHETDGRTLRQVIQLTFEKACDEAHWAPMYAKFCMRMQSTMSKDIKDEGIRDRSGEVIVGGALFRKYLLNRCQEEFERGWEINLPVKPEGADEVQLLSDDYYVAAAAKRRGLGLIQFIGELYKLGMLNIRIMHECVLKLLNFEGLPDESAIESLVKLLRTIGATMSENDRGPSMINLYFERVNSIMNMDGLPSRLYYMLLDTVDLRSKNWKSKDDNKGPKTLQEIQQDAQRAAIDAAERSKAAARNRPGNMGGGTRSFSGSPSMPPVDYARNQVGMDDLKKLTGRARQNPATGSSLGPSSLLSGRSGSGRRGLGPPRTDDSGPSSRTGTPPVKESITSKNTYEYVYHYSLSSPNANLSSLLRAADDVVSPPSTSANSPELSKTSLAKPEESNNS